MEKIIYYKGYRFTRDEKTNYYLSSKKINGQRKRLHRYIWENEIGVIPKGYHIHHKDGNKLNNQLSNFEILKSLEHMKHHGKLNSEDEEFKKRARENLIKNVIPKSIAWHKSEEGIKFHKKLGKLSWLKKEKIEYSCFICETKFKSLKKYSEKSNKFCSNKCKSRFRKQSGIDNIIIGCSNCGKEIETNKYNRKRFCSAECRLQRNKNREN